MFFFFFSSRRRHTRCALVTGVQTCALPICEASRPRRAGKDGARGAAGWRLSRAVPVVYAATPALWPECPCPRKPHSPPMPVIRTRAGCRTAQHISGRLDRYERTIVSFLQPIFHNKKPNEPAFGGRIPTNH